MLNHFSEDELVIRLGEHQLNTLNETLITKDFTVDLMVVHPEYDHPKPSSNDLALVRLVEEADLDLYTPACLPHTNQAWLYIRPINSLSFPSGNPYLSLQEILNFPR